MTVLSTYRVVWAVQGTPEATQDAYNQIIAAIRDLPGLTAILESGVIKQPTPVSPGPKGPATRPRVAAREASSRASERTGPVKTPEPGKTGGCLT
jgi:hypothetical protein